MVENKVIITIRINAQLRERLTNVAKESNRSRSNLAALLLEQGLNNYVEPNPQMNGSNSKTIKEDDIQTGRHAEEEETHNEQREGTTNKGRESEI